MNGSKMVLSEQFPQEFRRIPLRFDEDLYTEVFGRYKKETLAEILAREPYSALTDQLSPVHGEFANYDLGLFLAKLKKKDNDDFYLRFLNPHGDSTFSVFQLADPRFEKVKGVYAYTHGNELMYIDSCTDSMAAEIDQGYGKVLSRHCLLDGDPEVCQLNARVTAHRSKLSLWIHMMEDDAEIETLTQSLQSAMSPPWNE